MNKRRSRSRNVKKQYKLNFVPIIIFSIFLLLIFSAIMFSLLNIGSSNIVNNTYINGISVSSLTTQEAKDKLQVVFEEQLSKEIIVKFEDYKTTILPAEIDFSYDLSSALEEAYSIGRTGNIISNNIKLFTSFFSKTNIEAKTSYNAEKLDNVIENISVEIPNLVTQPSYYISNNELIITKGKAGNELDFSKTKDLIVSAIKNKKDEIILPVNSVEANAINISKIHDEIYSLPQNAKVIKEPYSVIVEKNGLDFAISVEEAMQLISSSDNDTYTIPLSSIPAEITVADLGEDIFGNRISFYTTKYDTTNVNRATNIEIACEKINGTVLEPGEVFSFNKVVGERTTKNGFKEAIIYSDGELDYGLGGGICQISSTLYNTVLLANLDIVERKNHSMTVSYLPTGQDATVSYGSVDFKFKNSRSYPIKLSATANSGVITISIYGVKESPEYNVEIVVDIIEKTDFDVSYEYSSSVPKDSEIIKQTGKYGYKCSTYKVLYLGGKEISRTLLSTDTYKPQKQIIQKHK